MFRIKNVCIGEKIYEPGKHFVLSTKGYSSKMTFDGNDQWEVFAPEGYIPVSSSSSYSMSSGILYMNTVQVKAKVYQKNGQQFCPDFGTPLTVNRRR